MKNKIDIENGRYWDRALSLVDGCTPCSPGCDHCWSAAMTKRFQKQFDKWQKYGNLVDENGRFNGHIITHPDRLDIPLRTRKPTVFAIWNDLFHEAVPFIVIIHALSIMARSPQHTFLILTKRAQRMADIMTSETTPNDVWLQTEKGLDDEPALWPLQNVWNGLTVCNQEEADEKIPEFLKVPGKKFLSIEPMLGPIDFARVTVEDDIGVDSQIWPLHGSDKIDAVILGGETGPGARPVHPDWVRSVRDQCEASNVPFYFKQWGKWVPTEQLPDDVYNHIYRAGGEKFGGDYHHTSKPCRLLDGRTHDDLPWVVK